MIENVCVCGAGTMGSGIARLMASNGISTLLYDVNSERLESSRNTITRQLQTLAAKGKITKVEEGETNAHLRYSSDINDCIADLIIEAIIEDLPAKTGLFNQLAEINHSEAIFVTNTSSLPVTAIANAVQHPQRVAGLHFFNPAPVMKLVELISTPVTDPNVLEQLARLMATIGKTVVACKDSPGFIVNRVARPFYLEALYIAETYAVPINDIDGLMKSVGFRMGPFELMDLIGNDINFAVTNSVYEALGKPQRLAPSLLQQQKVNEGLLGRKTGKGFYEYAPLSSDIS